MIAANNEQKQKMKIYYTIIRQSNEFYAKVNGSLFAGPWNTRKEAIIEMRANYGNPYYLQPQSHPQ